MRPAALLAGVLFLGGCGNGSTAPLSGPYACLGQPLPTTAANPVMISGVVTEPHLGTVIPVSGAGVAAFKSASDIAPGSTVTDAQGNYAVSLATGGSPLDGHLRAGKSGYFDTYVYPSAPIPGDVVASVLLLTASDFAVLQTLVNVTQTAGNGWIAFEVVDCTGAPITGATVSTSPAGTVRYDAGGTPSSSATVTGADGVAYVFNVTAGDVVVRANAAGHTLRSHTVVAVANEITVTIVAPGPLSPPQ